MGDNCILFLLMLLFLPKRKTLIHNIRCKKINNPKIDTDKTYPNYFIASKTKSVWIYFKNEIQQMIYKKLPWSHFLAFLDLLKVFSSSCKWIKLYLLFFQIDLQIAVLTVLHFPLFLCTEAQHCLLKGHLLKKLNILFFGLLRDNSEVQGSTVL